MAKVFPLSNEHVRAKFKASCNTMMHGGRYVAPAWRCGTCKQRHQSKYLNQQVPPQSISDLEKAVRQDAERMQVAQLRRLSIWDGSSDDDLDSDGDCPVQ